MYIQILYENVYNRRLTKVTLSFIMYTFNSVSAQLHNAHPTVMFFIIRANPNEHCTSSCSNI